MIAAPIMTRLSDFVASHLGLFYPPPRWTDLERGIRLAAEELEENDLELWIDKLVAAPLVQPQLEVLARYLTIGETYFFRERASFDALEKKILPELIRLRERSTHPYLRLWSVSCSTGEEPYSLAILLRRLLPRPEDWSITILATDLNPDVLKKAARARYGDWSFRSVPNWIRESYFTKDDNSCYEVIPEVQRMVTFAPLNLVENTYPSRETNTSSMDLIFCRNVLMYFQVETMQKIVSRLHRCLAEDGWLNVSPSEASASLFSEYTLYNFPGTIFYRKGERQPEEEKPRRPEVVVPPVFFNAPVPLPLTELPVPSPVLTNPEKALVNESIPRDLQAEASALFEEGNYTEAIYLLQKLLKIEPRNTTAMEFLVRSYANLGQLEQAQAWCEKAIKGDKLNVHLHFLRATLFLEQNRLEEATRALKNVSYLDPQYAMAYFELGNIAKRQESHDQAISYYKRTLSLLEQRKRDEILIDAGGITVGRFQEIIQASLLVEQNA